MCPGGGLPAILMDAGLIDLRVHFGLNIPPEETIKLQRKTSCSVLPMKNRVIERDASWWTARGFNDSKTTIEYGTYRDTELGLRPEATFLQSSALTEYQQSYGSASSTNYSQPDDSALGINTIPEMHRNDADVGLAVIWLNDVIYETPVNDPLFSAHKEWIWQPGGGYAGIPQYHSDNAAGVIACARQVQSSLVRKHIVQTNFCTQYRYCIPQSGKPDFCTPLAGSPRQSITEDFPQLKPVQLRLLQLLTSMSRLTLIEEGALTKNILAESYLTGRSSPGLPDDQWIKEVVAWESRVWASHQALISAAIIGPSVFDDFAHEYTEPVVDEGDRQLCQSLKMRKSGAFA